MPDVGCAMAGEGIEKYQMAGIDDRERGFNRAVTVSALDHGYRATLHYEQTIVVGESGDTIDAAMSDLVRTLHQRGYRQLKSQLSFRGAGYLGSLEPWMEYPDPETMERSGPGISGLVTRVMRLINLRWGG
jgi:hypothetical protein